MKVPAIGPAPMSAPVKVFSRSIQSDDSERTHTRSANDTRGFPPGHEVQLQKLKILR